MGSFFSLGKSSNDTQENPKDALKKEEELKKVQEVQEENAKLNRDKTDLTRERDNLNDQLNASQKQVQALEQSQQVLKNEKTDLTNKITGLSTEKENLTKDKENLTTDLSTAESQAEQTSQKLNELEQRHAPYKKLEKLYEVFLEVRECLNFNFVATTHSAMDLIASVLSDSKYYLENLYNKASQELSDKRSDKGEKLAELFDLLFEYIKDKKFERLKEPSTYDSTCKSLYPEQNASQKMQRVVLRGYTYDKKIACYTIVDMGS
ncbi:M protein [Helicobacter pylori]|uniref:M protein n=1 Tax=Helicobacter pylori TaxID=210 RepID=UPI0009AD695E|nr:M protein [Helicobacter pylori]